jgi:uncharacterized protein
MKILVDRLSATATPFRFEAGAGWWQQHMPADGELPDPPVAPFCVEGRAHTLGEDLYLEAAIEGELELECGRCLARYRHRLREPFRLVLEPAGLRTPADPEAAAALDRNGLCLSDEFETGWYRGGEIQLDSVCLEVISLALPVKPLCREDCAGLCAQCGADRNQADCGCEQIRPPSPFDVLASLRDGKLGGRAASPGEAPPPQGRAKSKQEPEGAN